MNDDNRQLDLVFAPQTLDQARLFSGMAAALVRRGATCLFAAPSSSIAESIAHEWGPFIRDASRFRPLADITPPACDVPECIGAYDVWRGRITECERVESARVSLAFWNSLIANERPRAVVVWNGRDHVFVESAVAASREHGCRVLCMELGPLRRRPMTVAVSESGINAAARFRRPDKLSEPLVPWEVSRLRTAVERFRSGIKPHKPRAPYVFFPLQVDDDTQLYYYAPRFSDSKAMVQALVAAMPADVQLIIKVHPLADARHGAAAYAPLLREQDRIASPATDTLGLIAGASAVVTNNSSAGVEALMLERPVVVLGEAHYAGRGFTHDYTGDESLSNVLRAAMESGGSSQADALRSRYLYELLFYELVAVGNHPLNAAISEEDAEQLAIRLWDLLQPDRLGSDWLPVFRQIHEMRQDTSTALQAVLPADRSDAVLVASRFADACVDLPSSMGHVVLEEMMSADQWEVLDREVFLLAPELNPSQHAEVAERLLAAGATCVCDVTRALSRVSNHACTKRFNGLPQQMRDALYRTSEYWDYYVSQTGISPDNNPAKVTQAATIVERLRAVSPQSVLEYGCGDGRILEQIALDAPESLRRCVGVDSSDRMLQLARCRLRDANRVALLPADARQELPFADREFDTALTCGALQHVIADDLPKVLEELHRVTRAATIHWEVFEQHQPVSGEHYTNPATSATIHRETLARFGPIEAATESVQPLTGQMSLLSTYHLDRPLLTVLTLHAIGKPDSACESFDYRNLFVLPDQLRELVEGLRDAGFSFLTPSEALARVRDGGSVFDHKTAVLTFDDGYASVCEMALPILAEYGIRAAAFISTDYIGEHFGGNARDGSGAALPMMTEDQIRHLCDAGWDVGAHSMSHRCFAAISDDDARRELVDGRARLEAVVGTAVSAFAFPYGEPELGYRQEHVEMAQEAGFELALTMRPGFVSAGHAGIDWPRIGIGHDTTADSLLAQIAAVHRAEMGWPANESTSRRTLQDRVRTVVRDCVDKNVKRIALYGAGRHTAKLLQTAPLLPLDVLGILDDDPNIRGDKRYGLPVYAPSEITKLSPDAVLISSDEYEQAIYERIAPLEASGISVLRLYADA